MDITEESIIEARKEKVAKIFKKKTVWIFIVLAILIFIAWNIRTSNVPGLKDITTGDYTLGPDLDPFLFLRYAQTINDNGNLPAIDNFRYVPLGFKTAEETMVLPYMMVYFYKIVHPIIGGSFNYAIVLFPAFMFLLTIIAFFFLVAKIFEEHKHGKMIAIIACAFLIVSPSLIPRTIAGIPEKESVGFLFLFLALYFFIASWKSEKLKKSLLLAGLSGLSTSIMGLIWGGWIYIFITISLFTFISFIFNQVTKQRFYNYSLWFLLSVLIPAISSARYSIKGLAVSTSSGISFGLFGLLLVDFLLFQTRFKHSGTLSKLKRKMPDKLITILATLIIGIILSSIFFGIGFLPGMVSDVTKHLTTPYTDRLSFTVAENRQPYFGEWKENFGPTQITFLGAFNIPPLIFWLFFIGSILLFYEVIKNLDNKERRILVTIYTLFLAALIFSRYSGSGLLNGSNFISNLIYFGSFILLLGALVQIFYKYHKEGKLEEFNKLNYSYLFLLAYFIPGLIGARSAIRLIMALAPPVAGLLGFVAVYSVEKAMNRKDSDKKIIFGVFAILIILFSAYSLYYNYNVSKASAKQMVPSVYTQQWQKAMGWVRENTSQEAVFAHWWDYGYWVQSIGERATVLDGGNAISYWNHLIGRHVLTGENEREALEFLYAHNATYLLIDSSDIGKYGAYSRIGSDENYDRYSWIGTFNLDEQNTQQTKNQTIYLYRGGVGLDEDYLLEENNQKILLPAGRAAVGGMFLTKNENGDFEQPVAVFIYNNKQHNLPLRYLYYNNELKDFKTGYEGTMYIIPVGSNSGVNVVGSSLFLSERNMRALWVKLYLLGEGDNFQLVHSEPDLIVNNINQQIKIGDFLSYYGIRGPIKIWKINYPADIEFKPEYLSTYYPESVMLDTLAS